jgi:hypothetical protein
MAGRPLRRAMIAELERRTREEFDDPTATTLDYVVSWVEGGRTLVGLLNEMTHLGDIKRGMLTRYLSDEFGDDAQLRLVSARMVGADALVEDGLEGVENSRSDKDSIALAKLKSDSKQWLAGKWNRAVYGEPKAGVAVQINMGSAFLESLRRQAERGRVESSRPRAFVSPANDLPALVESSSAIAPAIAEEAQDVTIEVVES